MMSFIVCSSALYALIAHPPLGWCKWPQKVLARAHQSHWLWGIIQNPQKGNNTHSSVHWEKQLCTTEASYKIIATSPLPPSAGVSRHYINADRKSNAIDFSRPLRFTSEESGWQSAADGNYTCIISNSVLLFLDVSQPVLILPLLPFPLSLFSFPKPRFS